MKLGKLKEVDVRKVWVHKQYDLDILTFTYKEPSITKALFNSF